MFTTSTCALTKQPKPFFFRHGAAPRFCNKKDHTPGGVNGLMPQSSTSGRLLVSYELEDDPKGVLHPSAVTR